MKVTILFHIINFFILLHLSNTKKIQNVVILLADDAGFEMGAYLNKYCQTENLDAFAKRSLIFNNAFTSVSSCSPSRAQILTGLPSHQSGMYGLHHNVHHFNVFDNIKSLPNILSKKNILTGLIGKKHVGPKNNFKFDYEQTEENNPINQVGRNITNIKLLVRKFLQKAKKKDRKFFLIVAFHDPHRCGHITPEYGEFCERWGTGEQGMGIIPDWKPIYYDWNNLPYPPYLQQTDVVKKEIAAQYMTISRLDQGVGLVLKEIVMNGFDENTLVIYTSDNGPPFPGGRTNLYDIGIREPMIIYSPEDDSRRNSVTSSMSSLLDIFPTVLDAFKVHLPNNMTYYTGKSLMPLLKTEPPPNLKDAIFSSQEFHEITMNYPMRVIRTRRYKLIHNINYQSYFPVDQDLYVSPTFQEILNDTIQQKPLTWIKTLKTYYKRPEWEMYDLYKDPLEQWNLIENPDLIDVRKKLLQRLYQWQMNTNDPWICAPHGVLQNQGPHRLHPACFTLGHDKIKLF